QERTAMKRQFEELQMDQAARRRSPFHISAFSAVASLRGILLALACAATVGNGFARSAPIAQNLTLEAAADFSNPIVLQGSGPTTLASFAFSFTGPTNFNPISVHYTTLDGTAKAGFDYRAVDGDLVIPLSQPFGVTVNGGLIFSSGNFFTKTFFVQLSNPSA